MHVEEHERDELSPPLQIPKNKSTTNLSVRRDSSEKARIRFSFDAGSSAGEYDTLTRLALLPSLPTTAPLIPTPIWPC